MRARHSIATALDRHGPVALVDVAGWSVKLGVTAAFVPTTRQDVAVLMLLVVVVAESGARALREIVADRVGVERAKGRPVRLAPLALRLGAIGAARAAVAALAAPSVITALVVPSQTPAIAAALLLGVVAIRGGIQGVLRAAGAVGASVDVSAFGTAGFVLTASVLVTDVEPITAIALSLLIGETIAVLVAAGGAAHLHRPDGWGIELRPTDVVQSVALSLSVFTPSALLAGHLQRQVAIDGAPGVLSLESQAALGFPGANLLGLLVLAGGAFFVLHRSVVAESGLIVGPAAIALTLIGNPGSVTANVLIGAIALGLPFALPVLGRTQRAERTPSTIDTSDITIVLTYRRDTDRLLTTVSSLLTTAARTWHRSDVIAVAVGADPSVVDRFGQLSWKRLRHVEVADEDRGEGIRAAVAMARSRRVVVIDLDRGPEVERLVPLVRMLDAFGLDAVVGSRRHPGSPRSLEWWRSAPSRVFWCWSSIVVHPRIGDPEGGMSVFRRSALHQVLPLASVRGDNTDIELIALLRRAGAAIAEAPVTPRSLESFPTIGDAVGRFFGVAWLGLRLRIQQRSTLDADPSLQLARSRPSEFGWSGGVHP